jgi:hypothetical protein
MKVQEDLRSRNYCKIEQTDCGVYTMKELDSG